MTGLCANCRVPELRSVMTAGSAFTMIVCCVKTTKQQNKDCVPYTTGVSRACSPRGTEEQKSQYDASQAARKTECEGVTGNSVSKCVQLDSSTVCTTRTSKHTKRVGGTRHKNKMFNILLYLCPPGCLSNSNSN